MDRRMIRPNPAKNADCHAERLHQPFLCNILLVSRLRPEGWTGHIRRDREIRPNPAKSGHATARAQDQEQG